MGTRRKARIIAFQALFSYNLSYTDIKQQLKLSWLDEDRLKKMKEETLSFARLIIQGTIENLKSIDGNIERQLEHWDFSRLNKVDLAILRMSVYCLLYQKDIPPSVTIDEAIDIAKEFGTDESYRFINGVLDGIRKQQNL